MFALEQEKSKNRCIEYSKHVEPHFTEMSVTFSVNFHIRLNIFSNNILSNEITSCNYKGTLSYYLIIACLCVVVAFSWGFCCRFSESC